MAFGYVSNVQLIDQEKTVLDHVVLLICQSFEIGQSDQVQLQIIKALLTAVTNCNVTGTSLRLTIKTCFNISISTKNPDNVRTSKTALTQMLNKVFQRMENFKTSEEYISHFVKNLISNVVSKNDSTKTSLSTYNKDAFFIFRALCKLSKQVPNSSSSESLEMKSRILSLSLISSILANSGPVFKNSYSFINDIKQHLCLSLLKNIVSPNSTIFNLSLSIFRTLVMFFKDHLKVEIGTLLSNALLKILESPNSTYQHKILVIQAIYTIVQDPQTLVDLFVNYDSGMQYYNIYESIVKDLAKVIQQTFDVNWVTPEQDVKIKITSLKALVTILKSMVNWTERKQKNEEKKEANHELFEKQRSLKKGTQEAVSLFNSEPKKGIKYAIENDLIKNDPQDIAKFLHTTEGLSKKEIGGYIGTSKNKEILDAFVKRFDFKGIDFLLALRSFLNAFRLPPEGQQIDIVVQKFAEKYYSDNQDQNFNNADACYVFTYSVIMLNTELHNPQFSYRERMSIPSFKKQNEGLNQTNDGTKANFSEEFQEQIYKQIKSDEIKLKGEEDQVMMSLLQESKEKDVKKKQMLFDKEGDYIFTLTSNQLSTTWARHFDDTFYYSSEIEHVKPMWDVSFGPILPALSGYFEKTDDIEVAKLCLEGFEYGIHISGMFDMTLPRDTFVNALYKFTGLSGLNQLKDKNLEAIKLLIKIAQTEGNYLKGSWSVVLNGISKLERLQNIQGIREQQSLKRQGSFTSNISRKVSMDIRGHTNELIEQSNSQILSIIDSAVIDKIFHSSIDLDNEAIVEFVKCLCAVSSDEIFSNTETRNFSLQKLIEVAHYNIGRIKLVWGKIWNHMSEHLIEVACKHENERIIMGSIDSLRQLAMKFLEQEELASYHFQRDFLKPFLHIISQSNRPIIKEMIVEICNRMILHQNKNIKSGWKSIFSILQVAAADKLLEVEKLAFSNMDVIMKEFFPLITEAFTDLINCLSTFAVNQYQNDLSTKAIDYILECSTLLVSGKVIQLEKIDDEFLFNEDKPHFKLWFPIFTGLSRSIQDVRKPVRLKGLATLFEILNQYGKFFTKGLWQLIFKGILYPIFAEIQTKESYTEWVNTTCEKAMILLVGLFSKYFNLIPFEFSNVIQLLVSTIRKEDELLTRIGLKCLVQLILDTSSSFTKQNWDQICETFNTIFEKLKSKETITMANVNNQLLTITSIGDALVSKHIDSIHIISLLKILDIFETNAKEHLETVTDKDLQDVLLKQESSIFSLELDILFKLKGNEFEQLLHEKTLYLLERYIKIMNQPTHIIHKVLVPTIVSLLNGINSFSEDRFSEYIEKYYSLFCEMIISTHKEVQTSLKDIFISTQKLIKK